MHNTSEARSARPINLSPFLEYWPIRDAHETVAQRSLYSVPNKPPAKTSSKTSILQLEDHTAVSQENILTGVISADRHFSVPGLKALKGFLGDDDKTSVPYTTNPRLRETAIERGHGNRWLYSSRSSGPGSVEEGHLWSMAEGYDDSSVGR